MPSLMDMGDIRTPEKFREYVETLEIARKLVAGDASAPLRIALIVLDNTAEVLMYHMCNDLFASDEFGAKVMPPRFPKQAKAHVRRYFAEKVRLLSSEGGMDGSDAAVLDVAHSYRNRAVHQDTHNPRGSRVITCLLFGVVGRLLAKATGGTIVGGLRHGEIDWIARYGLPTSHLQFDAAAAVIGEALGKGLSVDVDETRDALRLDLEERIRAITALLANDLYEPSDARVADMLAQEEFLGSFDEGAVAAEYREAIYQIAQGREYSRDEFARREDEYHRACRTASEQFSPTLSAKELRELAHWAGMLDSGTTTSGLLGVYVQADQRLSLYERMLSSAACRLDNAIQARIDIERGK